MNMLSEFLEYLILTHAYEITQETFRSLDSQRNIPVPLLFNILSVSFGNIMQTDILCSWGCVYAREIDARNL